MFTVVGSQPAKITPQCDSWAKERETASFNCAGPDSRFTEPMDRLTQEETQSRGEGRGGARGSPGNRVDIVPRLSVIGEARRFAGARWRDTSSRGTSRERECELDTRKRRRRRRERGLFLLLSRGSTRHTVGCNDKKNQARRPRRSRRTSPNSRGEAPSPPAPFVIPLVFEIGRDESRGE